MRILTSAMIATTVLVIGGCSTTAQNPNYQQTTKYKGSSPYIGQTGQAVVQQANHQTQLAAPVTYAPQEVPLGYAPQVAPVTATTLTRQSAPVYQAAPQAVTYEAPRAEQGLQENTTSLGGNGTPGYYAVNGTPPPVQTVQPKFTQIQPNQPQQFQPEPIPVPSGFTALPKPTGTIRHTVIPGDTLYSLARTTCSSVSEIQSLNAINAEFYIRAGEDILLPSGRCAE